MPKLTDEILDAAKVLAYERAVEYELEPDEIVQEISRMTDTDISWFAPLAVGSYEYYAKQAWVAENIRQAALQLA